MTQTACRQLLGVGAHRALGRGELAPALRATRDRSPLATLTRLFLLGSIEDEVAVGRALPRTGIAEAIDQGVLERLAERSGRRSTSGPIRPMRRNSCWSPTSTPTPGRDRSAGTTCSASGRRR